VLSAVTDRYLTYWSAHFQAYLWLLNGMSLTHLILSLFVGCIVALVAKGREMVATVTLGLIMYAMVGVAYLGWVAEHWPVGDAIEWFLWQCSVPLAIIVGGVIVRTRRSAVRTRPSRS
jgi:hypothetical protein